MFLKSFYYYYILYSSSIKIVVIIRVECRSTNFIMMMIINIITKI